MIRAVLDTTTIVSGVGWGGPPGAVLDAALAGRSEMVTGPTLLNELRRVLSAPALHHGRGRCSVGITVVPSSHGSDLADR